MLSAYGDRLNADRYGTLSGPPRLRLLMLHGLTGCSGANPIPQIAKLLSPQGVETWALNCRGAEGSPAEIPRLYHAGSSEDLHAAFLGLPQDRPWVFVGFSMGANILFKWLGSGPEGRLEDARALGISCPYDLKQCCENLDRTWLCRRYRDFLVGRLKRTVLRMLETHPGTICERMVRGCKTFQEFDDRVTGPLHGFADAEEYWSENGSIRYLPNIQVPTTLLHSQDDPFQPNPPTWIRSDFLNWEVKSTGGHLGFLESWQKDWLIERVAKFVLDSLG